MNPKLAAILARQSDPSSTAADPPATLRLQPEPLETWAVRHRHAAGWVTAILRRWSPGDSARCHLCPKGTCSAARDTCIIAVDELVPQGEAALYSTAEIPGFTWQDEPAPAGGAR